MVLGRAGREGHGGLFCYLKTVILAHKELSMVYKVGMESAIIWGTFLGVTASECSAFSGSPPQGSGSSVPPPPHLPLKA